MGWGDSSACKAFISLVEHIQGWEVRERQISEAHWLAILG